MSDDPPVYGHSIPGDAMDVWHLPPGHLVPVPAPAAQAAGIAGPAAAP